MLKGKFSEVLINNTLPETCNDGLDNNCNGLVDDGCTSDSDGDGYTDLTELSAGTDPNNVNEFPTSLFNIFNNI